ncbi:MAG: hypothetical protein WC641_01420 [Patescibacteria group bacterium]
MDFWWLGYRFSGANHEVLRQTLLDLRTVLAPAGHPFKTMIEDIQDWSRNPMTKREAIQRMLERTAEAECRGFLSFWLEPEPSEGRGFEVGLFAGRGKPTIMLVESSVFVSEYNQAIYLSNAANREHGLPSIIRYRTPRFIAKALIALDRRGQDSVEEPAPCVVAPADRDTRSGLDVHRPKPQYPFKPGGIF